MRVELFRQHVEALLEAVNDVVDGRCRRLPVQPLGDQVKALEKTGARDAIQVFANGGVFAVAAIGMLAAPDVRWFSLGAGALAASASDTWATEIGTLWGGAPRSILTARVVPTGTSGGITLIGSLGTIAGAAFMAAAAKRDVLLNDVGPRMVRLVTHLDVDDEQTAYAADVLSELLAG